VIARYMRATVGTIALALPVACGGEALKLVETHPMLDASPPDGVSEGDVTSEPDVDSGTVHCYLGDDNVCHIQGAQPLPAEECGSHPTSEYSVCYANPVNGSPRASCCASIGRMGRYDPQRGCKAMQTDARTNFGCYSFAGGCGYTPALACYARKATDGTYEYSLDSGSSIPPVMQAAGFQYCNYIQSGLQQTIDNAPSCS
jgi:hypothetical protein